MKFRIFARKTVEVIRRDGQWLVYDLGNEGKKRAANDIVIPASINESELSEYLADIFHEWATAEHDEIKRF